MTGQHQFEELYSSSKQRFQFYFVEREKAFDRLDLFVDVGFIDLVPVPRGNDHIIFRRVFGGDEFEKFRGIPALFEEH